MLDIEQTYNTYHKMVFNTALHYLQNKEDAEEITQDVFVTVYNKQTAFEGRSNLKTWIYKICINRCLDRLKSKKRKKRLSSVWTLFSDMPLNNDLAIDAFHPAIQIEQKEALLQLMHQIQKLPDQQKTALILSKFEQLPQYDVAEIMGVTVKAVESLLYRAKQQLKIMRLKK
jgi:RNA polymerase sigma-70 factor (ECF subfamily)